MKLSIIIPVYNLEDTISQTLESIKTMEFEHEYEVIIINDGSTDNSISKIEEYKNSFANFSIISINNSGVSNARNIGIRKAKGEFITFIDGDDYIEKGFLKSAIKEMEQGRYDFVQYNYRIIDNNRNMTYAVYNVEKDTIINNQIEMLKLFFIEGKGIYNAVWGKVFRKETICDTQFDDKYKVSEDQKFIFDVLRRAKSVRLKEDIGYNYCLRRTSAMNRLYIERYKNQLDVLDYCEKKIQNEEVCSLIKGQKMSILLAMYDYLLMSGRKDSEFTENIRKEGIDVFVSMHSVKRRDFWRMLLLKNCRSLYDIIVILHKRFRNRTNMYYE